MVNNRAKMRRSNKKVINYLLKKGFSFVYLIPHIRWDTITYFKNARVHSKDIAGLFDGIALKNNKTYYLQISSNRFHTKKPYEEFASKYNVKVLLFKVVDYKGVVEERINC